MESFSKPGLFNKRGSQLFQSGFHICFSTLFQCFHSVVVRAETVTLVTTHHPFIKPNSGVPSWNRTEICAPSLTFLPVRGCGCDLEAGRMAPHPRDALGLDGTFYFIHFRQRKTECAQAGEGQDRERTPSRPSPPPQAEWEACVGPRVRSHNLSWNQTWPLARRGRPRPALFTLRCARARGARLRRTPLEVRCGAGLSLN